MAQLSVFSMALIGRSKPVHLRGSSREDEDAVFAAEDAKRPRAVSPSSTASPAVCTAGTGSRGEESSIYKLTSPWLTVASAPKESHDLASRDMGGVRALCFEEEGEGAEQEVEEEEEEDQVCTYVETVEKKIAGLDWD